MALHTLTDEGHMTWACLHCKSQQTAHVSHEQVEWTGYEGMPPHYRLVALPPCADCGARTFLKAHFTEDELHAPNMWLPWNTELESRLQLLQHIQIAGHVPEEFARVGYTMDVVREEMAQLAAMKSAGGVATPSRAVAERHMQLVGHMEKHGKGIPPQ